ncbi:MAG TPA: ABC transporter ATP-binding protein [Pseudonocardiaceae bacterium]|jgi:iron(III) transport system ATP-binding protein|nr:ABC transporter ATP-binding protein [Pseudonocardiaceae bacterium]
MSELCVRGVWKSFGATPVLRGVDLTVPRGALAAVLGPSGCGKTTLLRVVAGFETADAGEVIIGGRLVTGPGVAVPPEHRRVGVVPQEGALFPHLSVAGNVGFGLPRGRQRAVRVEEMLVLVGLGGYGTRMPAELSGGQQQRVALARALAPGPALVLLDEPFSALDTGLRAALREDVRSALHATGATAVLVTHDQQEALSTADVVAVLQHGSIVQAGTPADLYSTPSDLQVAIFLGEAVVLDAVLRTGDTADCVLGTLPVRGAARPSGSRGTLVLRPEQVLLGPPGRGVSARVAGVVFYGHDALVRLALAEGAVPVTARTAGGHRLQPDDEVGLTVSGAACFFPS